MDKQKLLELIKEYGDARYNIAVEHVKGSIESSTLWEESSEAILQQIKEAVANG